MALPESFQIALKRAQTERKIEQEQILAKIGDTVRSGVPLLSGVIAGALSRSPIIGIGTAFIADKLQQRSEEKREQRRASRLEMRQRREAAKILASQNEDMSFREAMRLIEKNAVEKEQELNEQREQQLLDQFGVGEQQRQLVEQQVEQVGEPVQSRESIVSSTLEDTVSRIDENISGILDVLVEKFGTDEQRAERAAARQAFLDARRREELAEIARNVLPRRDVGEPERIEDDSARQPSFLARIGGFLKDLFTSKFILLPLAAGLAALFAEPLGELYDKYFGPNGKFRPELERIGGAIKKRIDEASDYLYDKLKELFDKFLENLPTAISDAVKKAIFGDEEQPETAPNEGFSEEEIARLTRLNSGAFGRGARPPRPVLPTPAGQRVVEQVRERLLGNLVPIPEGQRPTGPGLLSDRGLNLGETASNFRFFARGFGGAGPLLQYGVQEQGESGLPIGAENVIRDTIKIYGFLNMTLEEAYDGIKQQVDKLFNLEVNEQPLDLVNPQSSLGASLNTVSGAQNAIAFAPVIAPQTTSQTSITQTRNTSYNGSAINPYASEYKFQTNRTLTA